MVRVDVHNIYVAGFVFASMNSVVQLFMPLYSLSLGFSVFAIGSLTALPSVTQLMLRLAVGQLSDRYGERRLLEFSGLVCLVAAMALALSPWLGLVALVGSQVMVGLGRAAFWTVGRAYATKLPGSSGRHVSLLNAACSLGQLSGLAGTGFLVAALGYPLTSLGIISMAALYCVTVYSLPTLGHRSVSGIHWATLLHFVPKGLNLRGLTMAGVCAFVAGIPTGLATSFYPVLLAEEGYDEKEIGLAAMLIGVGMLAASLHARRHLDRIAHLPRAGMIAISATGMGLSLVPLLPGNSWLMGVLLATGFAGGYADLIYQLLVHRYSPPERRGAAMAYAGFFWGVSLLVVPFLVGLVATRLPLAGVLTGLGLMVLLLGLAVLAWMAWRTLTPTSHELGPVSEDRMVDRYSGLERHPGP